MISACKRFVENYPNLVILLVGLWFHLTPIAFGVYLRGLIARDQLLTGVERWIEQFTRIHSQQVGVTCGIMLIFGVVLIGFAVWRMVRRRPHKR